jgi:nucleotide-binding universal stress UspA family protein
VVINQETAMNVRDILFATDLSARCDRALARTAKITAESAARLRVVHAVSSLTSPEDQLAWRQTPDPLQVARRKVLADISDYSHLEAEVLVEHAEPAELILNAIRQRPCDLIITGMARDETGGRVNMGATINTLVHETDVPVLVVKARARNNYDRIIVATDFSEGSRSALEATLDLFPQAQIILFHAFDVIYETFMEDKAAARDAMHRQTMEKSRAFIAEALLDEQAGTRIFPVCEYGYAGTLLSDRVQRDEVDLVVLGTEGRSGLAGFLLGSAGQRLATEMPGDVLLVRRRKN